MRSMRRQSAIGADIARLGPKLAGMTKHNQVAIYVSNGAQTAFNSFKPSGIEYNQVLRPSMMHSIG